MKGKKQKTDESNNELILDEKRNEELRKVNVKQKDSTVLVMKNMKLN
jgi:hypothetical protein